MFKSISAALLSLGLLSASAEAATSVSLFVPGEANPYLAGMPNGTTDPADARDSAPTHAPAQVLGLALSGGDVLTFSASGTARYGTTSNIAATGPDGGTNPIFSHSGGAAHGISNITAPAIALLGVFLDDTQPDGFTAPAALSFGTVAQRNFTALAPDLRQLFFIGDGLTDANAVQDFTAPTGTTRLFLGTMDAFGWFNNSGGFNVTVTNTSTAPVPLPAGGALLLSGLGLLAWRKARG